MVHNKIDFDCLFIDNNNLLRLSNFSSSKIIQKNQFIKKEKIKSKIIPPELKKNNFYDGKSFDIFLIGSCLFQMIFKKPYDNNKKL